MFLFQVLVSFEIWVKLMKPYFDYSSFYNQIYMAVFVLSVVFAFIYARKQSLKYRSGVIVFLLIYIGLTLYSTVFGRHDVNPPYFCFTPFWSYIAIFEGKTVLIGENILNILLFFPIGFGLNCIFSNKSPKYIICIGLLFSLLIEIFQFSLHKGWFELDDLFHNTIGCYLGNMLYKRLIRNCQKLSLNESNV